MKVIAYKELPEQIVTRSDVIGEQYNRHLLSAAATGTDSVVADVVRFPPGFVHKLHRHPVADQVMFVVQGTVTAFDETDEVEVGPGAIALFPSGKWHGARVAEPGAEILNLFCGVGAIPEAGYEEHPEADRLPQKPN
ncbi:MAG: cupin domain-containing protein [Thermomicrobiales bacterium]